MRLPSILASILLPVLCFCACSSTPVAPPTVDIAGDWYGTMMLRGVKQATLLHLSRSADGHYTGTADFPGSLEFDLPLKSIAGSGEQVTIVIDQRDAQATFTGAIEPVLQQIKGQMKGDGPAVELALRPVDSAVPEAKRPQSLFYEIDGRRIHYVQIDGPSEVRVVFIHGTPGDWEGWREYLGNPELQRRATLIAVDRPGFGESKGDVVPDLHEQARLLAPLLRGPTPSDTDSKRPVTTIVVGHSLGGPIAAELAMDYPQAVQGALLVAPSIDPATETPRWYNQAMTWWAVNALVTRFLDPELKDANLELMPLSAQLKTMEPRWKSLPMPVTVIQGVKDDLVDPRTADFAERVLPPGNSVIRVPDEGHFVLWEKPQIELQALQSLLDRGTVAGDVQVRAVR